MTDTKLLEQFKHFCLEIYVLLETKKDAGTEEKGVHLHVYSIVDIKKNCETTFSYPTFLQSYLISSTNSFTV